MSTSYRDLTRDISAELGKLRTEIPDTLKPFMRWASRPLPMAL